MHRNTKFYLDTFFVITLCIFVLFNVHLILTVILYNLYYIDEKKVPEEKDEKEKEVGSEGVVMNVMVRDILLMAAKKEEEEKVLKNEIEQNKEEELVENQSENENENSQTILRGDSALQGTETVVEVTQDLTDLEEIRKNEKMPINCRVVEIESPWTDTEELRKYMIENCITSKSWKRRQKCVNLLCNDDALVQKGSLGKILVDICTNIYFQVCIGSDCLFCDIFIRFYVEF